jgi:hypothetical protein
MAAVCSGSQPLGGIRCALPANRQPRARRNRLAITRPRHQPRCTSKLQPLRRRSRSFPGTRGQRKSPAGEGAAEDRFVRAVQDAPSRAGGQSSRWLDPQSEPLTRPFACEIIEGFSQARSKRRYAMGLIILLIVLILLFGGGGFYVGAPYHYYGGGLSLVLVIVIVVLLLRGA